MIVLDETSSLTMTGNFLIDNCTITGGLKLRGQGTIKILNTNWVVYNGSPWVINCLEANYINLRIINSKIISNVSSLFLLAKNTTFYAENSILNDVSSGDSIGIDSSRGGISITILNCTVSSKLCLYDGGGTSKVNIMKSKWVRGQRFGLNERGISVYNMSSVTINENTFDMNIKEFVIIERTINVSINDNVFKFNKSKQEFTHQEGEEWIEKQTGLSCYWAQNKVQITNNTFTNLGKAITLVGDANQTVVIENNIFGNCQYRTMYLQSIESIILRRNYFKQCYTPIFLTSLKAAEIKDNVFNNSLVKPGNDSAEDSEMFLTHDNIHLYTSENVTITNNSFIVKYGGGSSLGVLGANNVSVYNNKFHTQRPNNRYNRMISFSDVQGFEISGNYLYNETIILKRVNKGLICLNLFLDSKSYQYDVLDTKWDNGTHGNYWSQHEITDYNGDLIGDIPYQGNGTDYGGVEYSGVTDNYPLSLKFFRLEDDYPSGSSSYPYYGSSITYTESLSNQTTNTITESLSNQTTNTITESFDTNAISFSLIIIIIFLVSWRRLKRGKRKDY